MNNESSSKGRPIRNSCLALKIFRVHVRLSCLENEAEESKVFKGDNFFFSSGFDQLGRNLNELNCENLQNDTFGFVAKSCCLFLTNFCLLIFKICLIKEVFYLFEDKIVNSQDILCLVSLYTSLLCKFLIKFVNVAKHIKQKI